MDNKAAADSGSEFHDQEHIRIGVTQSMLSECNEIDIVVDDDLDTELAFQNLFRLEALPAGHDGWADHISS